jgi:diguanylate cyclase (GGDEF)-like protein
LNVAQARRFPGDAPGFYGFAFLGIDVEFFSKWLEPVAVEGRRNIAIFDTRLVLLARKPAVPELLGTKINNPSLKAFIESGESSKIIRLSSFIDGETRLVDVRKVRQLPFIIVVGESDKDWMAHWWSRAWGETLATLLIWGMAALALRNHWALAERTTALEEANGKLTALSTTDGLTGLANRRRFDETFASEWARANRTQQPLALLMLDIDHFKEFNDHFGHQAGDECLKSIGSILHENMRRANDFVARYGGEEFCVVLPNTDGMAAQKLAETVRDSIESLHIMHGHLPEDKVTISIGVAWMVPCGPDGAESLLLAADMALYRAKQGGRNQVQVAPEISPKRDA